MENFSEKQIPDFKEMVKTLSGIGNALIQAEMAGDMTLRHYDTIRDLTFECGDFRYEVNDIHPYDEESYTAFLCSMKDRLRAALKICDERISALGRTKAAVESYLTGMAI